ncbi:hypothetical protein AB1K70_02660 [Bremerella sp. JC770]|uniref:hypothetical protein n=1 Tax=Bremerella sp. JC770 TaxID=3232137 RepID=UPI00345B2AFF
MMQNQFLLAPIVLLLAASFSLADDKEPALEFGPTDIDPTKRQWKLEDGPNGKVLKEVEEIRKQLGAEYSIESEELGIKRDDANEGSLPEIQPDQEWTRDKLFREVRQLVNRFRDNARHLEELAAQAEQTSEYGLADQLREMARHQWEHARKLSARRPSQPHENLWQFGPQSGSAPAYTPPPTNTYSPLPEIKKGPPESHFSTPATKKSPYKPSKTHNPPSEDGHWITQPSPTRPKY